MTIKVRVSNQLDPGNTWEVTLPEPLATIGRQVTCSVALPDPEKHVSRVHATVEARDGGYCLLVNSKVNPVQLEGNPCAPGVPMSLRNGSRILLYPFELAVEISGDGGTLTGPASAMSAPSPVTPPPAPAQAPSAPARDSGDPFAWLDDLHAPGTSKASADPFAFGLTPPPPQAAPARAPDPFLRDAPPTVGSGLMAGLGGTPSPSPTAALGLGDDLGLGNMIGGASPLGGASLDPLALLGGAPSSSSSNALLGNTSSLLAPIPTTPRAAPADDFLGVNLGPAAPAAPGGPLVDFGHPVHQGSSNLDHVHDFNLPFSPPTPSNSWPAQPAAAPMGQPPTAPAPAPAAPAAAPAASALGSQGDITAFLKGLGANGFSVAPEEAGIFFERAGEIVRASVQALITLLLARGEIKKELRAADRTMLAAQNNNPLKFMAATDEAVRFLFDPKAANAGAFLPPAQAIADAGDELVAHEMALVAGMRAAVVGSIKRFDPMVLEQKLAGGLPLMKKSRLWELYLEQYQKLQQDMADDLDRLFESEFQSAYAEQVYRMKKR